MLAARSIDDGAVRNFNRIHSPTPFPTAPCPLVWTLLSNKFRRAIPHSSPGESSVFSSTPSVCRSGIRPNVRTRGRLCKSPPHYVRGPGPAGRNYEIKCVKEVCWRRVGECASVCVCTRGKSVGKATMSAFALARVRVCGARAMFVQGEATSHNITRYERCGHFGRPCPRPRLPPLAARTYGNTHVDRERVI